MNLIAERLEEVLWGAINSERLKGFIEEIRKVSASMEQDIEYYIKDNLSYNLASFVEDMANGVVTSILNGDEEEMRRFLQCRENGWTGRDREHPIIRGEMFEQGAISLRKKIVDAYPDLLKTERILDLEDQLKSAVKMNNKLESELRDSNRESADLRRRYE